MNAHQREIVAAAMSGYPQDAVHPLFVSQHDDHAAVLLETGSSSHSYPYLVLCRKVNGEWEGGPSSNMPGWYRTFDDAGVVVFWGDTEGLTEPIEVEFKARRWAVETNGGAFLVAWWDELDPGNHIEPQWPEVADAAGR